MFQKQSESAQGAVPSPPQFEAVKISKSFGTVTANRDISLVINAGEKHAILGENGAGKSTLVKMINGVLRPDSGHFCLRGSSNKIDNPAEAKRHGIGMVFQHFSSFEALTVAENIELALPDIPRKLIRKRIRSIGEKYGLSIDPNRRVERLSAGEKQRVEIVRVLLQEPKLLILDEPTSVLTPQEAQVLFKTLDILAADGMALIYISHRLPEIRDLCDKATILRQGQVVGSCIPSQTSIAAMAEMMIGKTADPAQRRAAYVGAPLLEVSDLSVPVQEGMPLSKVSFSARRGEVLGIAGVAGEGQDTLFAALSGERRIANHRSIKVDGKPIGALGPTARRKFLGAFAPEQRLGHAAVPDLSLSENLKLTRHGMLGARQSELHQRATIIRDTYDVRAGSGDPKASTLSGGNLQKFVIGRELDRDPKVFIAAQPTWGVDAGAASVIRRAMLDLAERGAAVVVISQDLDEIFQIADRIAVIHRGTLSDTYPIAEMHAEKVGMLMAGADISEMNDAPSLSEKKSAPISPAQTLPKAITKPRTIPRAPVKPQPAPPASLHQRHDDDAMDTR